MRPRSSGLPAQRAPPWPARSSAVLPRHRGGAAGRAPAVAALACLVGLGAGLGGGEPVRAQQGGWSVATSMPVPKQESGMVALGNRVYVMGGYGAEPVPDTLVQVYDADANS